MKNKGIAGILLMALIALAWSANALAWYSGETGPNVGYEATIHVESNGTWSGIPATYKARTTGNVVSRWGIQFWGADVSSTTIHNKGGSVKAYLYSREDGVATTRVVMDMNQSLPQRNFEYIVTPVGGRQYKPVATTNSYEAWPGTNQYDLNFLFLP